MKKSLFTIFTLILTVVLGVQITNAIGSLTPSGTAGDDTQVSLNDIYNALDDFTSHTVASTTNPFALPGSVSATFHTLSEIYALISAESSDLVPENIAEGVTVFGVEGTMEAGVPELQRSTVQSEMNWANAIATCAGTVDGSTGWRLPTQYELAHELVKMRFLSYGDFGAGGTDPYWTNLSEDPGYVYIIEGGSDSLIPGNIPEDTLLRFYCVK